jgi:hypothetical protein
MEGRELARGIRGDSGFVVLGEANRMTDAILSDSAPRKEAHLFGRNQYMSTYFHSLSYLASKKGFILKRASDTKPPTSDAPYFFISQVDRSVDSLGVTQYDFVQSKSFGRLGLYQFTSKR